MTESRMMVMVASLERHLEQERKVLFEAILGQGGFPIGLSFPVIPANYILKLNLQCVADADYVFLLVGSEYGALSDKGVGYIHATYAAAKAARKPVVSLIYNGDVNHSIETFDRKRLEGFILQLKTDTVYYWDDLDSLRDCAERGLETILESNPSQGWIRNGSVATDGHASGTDQNLVQRLKHQVAQLTHKLSTRHSATASTQEPLALAEQAPLFLAYQCNAFREGRLKQIDGNLSLPVVDIFEWLSPTLLTPVTEVKIRTVLSSRIQNLALQQARTDWPGSHAVSDIRIDQNSIDGLKIRLRALSLIMFDSNGRWQLSEVGERLALTQS